MEKREKIKKLTLIILLALGSAYFLYSGFSLLFEERGKEVVEEEERR